MYFSACQTLLLISLLSEAKGASSEAYVEYSDPPEGSDYNARIYNGKPVNPPHSRPYVVQVIGKYQGRRYLYAGIIYNEWTVITTTQYLSTVTSIIAGKYKRGDYEDVQQERAVCIASKHPQAAKPINGAATQFDYAVLHLKEPLVFDEFVQPAIISLDGENIVPIEKCKLVGWGRTAVGTGTEYSKVLMESAVSYLDDSLCDYKHDTNFCLNRGGCFHDWGAPLICPHDKGFAVTGYVSAVFEDCKQTIIASTAQLPMSWLKSVLNDGIQFCQSK